MFISTFRILFFLPCIVFYYKLSAIQKESYTIRINIAITVSENVYDLIEIWALRDFGTLNQQVMEAQDFCCLVGNIVFGA